MERVSGYTEEERRALREALDAGSALTCPICGGSLTVSRVEPRSDVPYVRHRAWVRCPACRRTTTLDLPPSRSDDRVR
jgi:uncharacterized protein with PIN domain